MVVARYNVWVTGWESRVDDDEIPMAWDVAKFYGR